MSKKLLLVDDEPMILTRLKMLLEDEIDEVYTAENGQEALDFLNKTEVDCIVCDVKMPVMDGVELIKRLRKVGSEVLFIFFSGHGSEELMREVVPFGVFDFIDKPGMENLEETIRRAFLQLKRENDSDVRNFESEYQKLLKLTEEE